MKSIVKKVGNVIFPEFTGERVYMVPFTKNSGLIGIYARWNDTAMAMADSINTNGTIYFMADQNIVKAGNTHRRGGAHIDGNYGPMGFGNGFKQIMGWSSGPPNWKTSPNLTGGIVLASDHVGCVAYNGEFDGEPNSGGDCSHIDLSSGKEIIMAKNKIYAGNVTMIHKTIPADNDQRRTVARLILPEDYIFQANNG